VLIVTELGWARVEAIMQAPVLIVDDTQPPVSAVGGTSPEALPIAGLPEAQAVRDAFASVGWSVDVGHDWSLTAGFACDGVPTSFSFSFDQTPAGVRSWVTATATLTAGPGDPVTPSERELVAAVMDYAENPFPSMAGMIRMGRSLTYTDVDEAHWPQPFAQAALDWNVFVAAASGPRYEAMDPPVRSLLVGYHWMPIPDPTARATVITQAVNALPTVLAALGDLQRQDPATFRRYMGESIPSVQMGTRWPELKGGSTTTLGSGGAPTLSSTGSKIGASPGSGLGASTVPAPTPAAKFCSQCGGPRQGGARFCGDCGSAFDL
jgi:hypothetical protein